VQTQDKILHLIQPGRIGDVIICLPIAKKYVDRGYKIKWYINNQYAGLLDYVDYVIPVLLKKDLHQNIQEAYNILSTVCPNQENILDLGIGFAHHKETEDFFRGNVHFDEWKYNKAGIDINEKYKLIFNRNKTKEEELKKYLGIEKNTSYKIVHQTGSRGHRELGIEGIEVKPIKGFTIFDWYSILKGAKEIYCVDSCILNFVNQLDLCVGRRYVKLWNHGSPLLSPILKEDWKFL